MKSKKSDQEWKEIVNNYRNSELSIVKFSVENDLHPSTLAYWINKFRSNKNESEPKLVRVTNPIISAQKMTLSYGGVVIELPKNIPIKVITSLISTIREIY